MTDFLKQDVFFFVTTISVVVVTIFAAVALFYIVRILRNVEDISETAKEQTQKLSGDIDEARQEIKVHARTVKHLIKRFSGKKK